MRRVCVIVLLAGALGCDSATGPVRLTSPADVQLKIGQAAVVDGQLTVRFVGVVSDSRCPAGAMCFWGGDAEVAITLSLDGGAAEPDTLHMMTTANSDTTAIYIVSLLDLTPYPSTTAPIPAEQYAARLHVVAYGIITTTEAAPPRR